MAKIPIFRKLIAEEFPDQVNWIQKLLFPLNDFFTTTYTALNRTLTFKENFNADILDIVANGGQTIQLKNPLKVVPVGVVLIKLSVNKNNPSEINVVHSLTWSYDYNNSYINVKLLGLDANTQYSFKILVIGG